MYNNICNFNDLNNKKMYGKKQVSYNFTSNCCIIIIILKAIINHGVRKTILNGAPFTYLL